MSPTVPPLCDRVGCQQPATHQLHAALYLLAFPQAKAKGAQVIHACRIHATAQEAKAFELDMLRPEQWALIGDAFEAAGRRRPDACRCRWIPLPD